MSEEEKRKYVPEITSLILKYVLPDNCSDKDKEANPIAAEEVVEAIKAGKSVEIVNAVIEGSFNLESVVVKGKITIARTKFKGTVDCSYATFKKVLSLKGSTFEADAKFRASTVEKDIFLNDRATFQGAANFDDLTVTGVFQGKSITFKKDATFNGTQIKRDAFFSSTTFEGKVEFISAYFGGDAYFSKAVFKQNAFFASARIEGNASFPSARFKNKAQFRMTRFGGLAEFTDAVFEGEADFEATQIRGTAEFAGAEFKGKASFSICKFEENTLFGGAVFEKDVYFQSASFRIVSFYRERISFRLEKLPEEIQSIDSLKNKIKYDPNTQILTFEGVMTEEERDKLLNLSSAPSYQEQEALKKLFQKSLNPETEFHEKVKIDLRGCTYERIYRTSIWKELMKRLEPYDRQPFTQLEETFHRSGMDDLANDVYYERKRRESAQIAKRPFTWIKDRFLWLFTGYGLRLERLLILIIIILVVGWAFFGFIDGALEPKQERQTTAASESEAKADEGLSLTWLDPFLVSLNLFLPVDIPAGEEWKPSTKAIWGVRWFTVFGTLLTLTGWVLVPVAVAGISGILKR